MLGWLVSFGGWSWVLLGLLLIGGELLSPGIFLIWLGLAALLTGAAVAAFSLGWQTALLVFAALCLVMVAAGRLLTRRRAEEPDAATGLNAPGRGLVGRVFVLETTLKGGEGRIRIGDSSWRVTGPELLAGTQVRVLRVDGATLVVAKA